ncbi:diguanylate cyclase response regulator [Nostoc sp. 'Peltigera membranacea cyanobiont' 213]|uniref:GGDEF domain-containing response regulator n=1 Tax=unclassified Nostoc TaxID=2593658 RepID=UPI000B955A7C|nr:MULTISPECIES: diguanylate cyclase [unclassified Nostoc]AVH67455.1 response regulator receiver modulated diguanylate cyclase [Nostoc sp. 'Peltigera membranacea cyanobiont' N6]OYD92186.1 diguanylate cyclase response regulator [Nostoc sp. 'Peltigera membranacea cyanobiont' 213]
MANLLKSASETNILIVDDTPDNLRLLTKILESQGYIIRKSLNGRMALQAAYRYPPDLILLDINMPEMNGYEVCQQLKASKTTDQIPIIFISALDQINDKVQAFELGGQDYITKPFQELEVLMRVKNQLLIKQQYQQLLEQNQRLEHEIQERLKAEADIRQLSLTDDLTGLYNRRGFFWLANQQFKIAQRTQMLCCLLFVDLDGLKQINDSLGHEIGDRMIVDTAQILKQTFRDSDIVARLGGDEFVIFVPICSKNTDEFYPRLQASIDRYNQDRNYLYQLSISIGVTQCTLNENVSLEQLIEEADKLMYEHKRAKRLVEH